jgi:hypothetical protein
MKLTFPDIELFPSFNYGRDEHVTTLTQATHCATDAKSLAATFRSKDIQLQLDVAIEQGENETSCPLITFRKEKRPGVNGEGLVASIRIEEGQTISFVLRNDIEQHVTENITVDVLDAQQHATQSFWYNFIGQSNYKGRWREVVSRSLMILKMMTYGENKSYSGCVNNVLKLLQSLPEPLLLPRPFLSLKPSAVLETGTTAIAGFATQASPSISSFASVSRLKLMPIWSLSWNDSFIRVVQTENCRSCSLSGVKLISQSSR